jgi:hypothetical protein
MPIYITNSGWLCSNGDLPGASLLNPRSAQWARQRKITGVPARLIPVVSLRNGSNGGLWIRILNCKGRHCNAPTYNSEHDSKGPALQALGQN